MRIIVKNFGPIAQADIELKNLTLLIGEQASGKSTLAKVVYFFKSIKEEIYRLVRYEYEFLDLTTMLIPKLQDRFTLFFGSSKLLKSDFEITYYYAKDRFFSIHNTQDSKIGFYSVNQASTFTSMLSGIQPIYEAIKKYQKVNDFEALESYGQQLKIIIDDFFEDSQKPIYIPAGRNISVSYPDYFQKIFFSDLDASIDKLKPTANSRGGADLFLMQDFIRYTERSLKGVVFEQQYPISETINKILKHEYKLDNGVEKLLLNDNDFVRLDQASTGQQESIRILQDIYLCITQQEKAFRVIEEPEAHLFPKAQKLIIELLATMVNQTNSQVMLTTHSPYVLMLLNNLLYANQVDKLIGSQRIVAKEAQLCEEHFVAYTLKAKGERFITEQITNNGLIGHNYLDEISEEIGQDFEEMYQLHANYLQEI